MASLPSNPSISLGLDPRWTHLEPAIQRNDFQHRMNMKISIRLEMSAKETQRKMFERVYGSDTISRTQAFDWHRHFREGRESVNDNKRSGRPQT
ncbi:hypothetical protein TNCV_1637751 [Trichonephila clavipes]|nr:hypothetical protein TNCV_1637751 [Trichonephila clavipes]